MAIRIRIRQQYNSAVSQPRHIHLGTDAATNRGHQVLDLLVLHHLFERRAFGVQHLSSQRQNRLRVAVTALLGRTTRRVTFNDEQLRIASPRVQTVAQLTGQHRPLTTAFTRHRCRRGA